jgi:hypothetical protein
MDFLAHRLGEFDSKSRCGQVPIECSGFWRLLSFEKF